MKKSATKLFVLVFAFIAGAVIVKPVISEETVSDPSLSQKTETTESVASDAIENPSAEKVKQDVPSETPESALKPTRPVKRIDRADAFLAGPDWDFDGFVAGGQDSNVRSMFYLNDLIYINIGSQHGIATGDKLGIYKRGDRIKDPQTGKFIGYEVRRAAIARASDRVEDDVAAVRIINTFEPVEIGDLVRREQ